MLILIKQNMEVHLCTFEIVLNSVKFTQNTRPQQVEAVWRSEKGEIIIVGAMKPNPKNGIASFNEAFQIKTDLLRDPQTQLYHSNTIIFQIRRANQALQTKLSASISRFNLAQVLNEGPLPEKYYPSEDNTFSAVLSIKCSSIQDTGIKKALRRKSSKKLSYDQLQMSNPNHSQEIERQRLKSNQKKSRSSSRQNTGANTVNLQKQLKHVKEQLEREQTDHVLAQQRLRQVEMSLAEHEHLVNQLSALVSQRETDIVEMTSKLSQLQTEIQKLRKQNIELHNSLKVKDQEQKSVRVLEQRIRQLQMALEASNKSYHSLLKSENQLERNCDVLQQKNSELQTKIEKLKNDILNNQMEKEALLLQVKNADKEKNLYQQSASKYQQEAQEAQKIKEQEINRLQQEYKKIFQKYHEAVQKLNATGEMVHKSQLDSLEELYEEKIAQQAQKQAALKLQMEVIEQEMTNLEDILEEKEENQQILIDHAKKLQHDLDSVNFESNWWLRVLSKEIESPTLPHANGTPSKHSTDEILRERVRQLLRILQDSSKSILESERNKREIVRLEKHHEQLLARFAQISDEMKQVKDRLSIMMKENKKLLEKHAKVTKEMEVLTKANRKLNQQLISVRQRQQQIKENFQFLSYNSSLLEKELDQVKELLHEYQTNQFLQRQPAENQCISNARKKYPSLPMEAIKETNEELIFSIPITSGHCSEIQQTPNQAEPSLVTAREISSVLEKRVPIMEELLTQISKLREEKDQGLTLLKQLKQVQGLANKFKITLLRAGQKAAIKDWQCSIRRLSNQVDKLLLIR